jgi:hypothetical protein
MSRHNKPKRTKKQRTERSYTPLSDHKRVGKTLPSALSQLMAYPGFRRADWVGERLPEMLWAAILLGALGREAALERLRATGLIVQDRVDADETRADVLGDVSLSGLARWNDDEFDQFITDVIRGDGALFAGLLGFDDLPGVERWRARLGWSGMGDLDALKRGVGLCLWHQSQQSTDCRWMRMLARVLAGKYHLPTEEMVRQYLEYPHFGDQQRVRPSIRAAEIQFGAAMGGQVPPVWPTTLWKWAYAMSADDHTRLPRIAPTIVRAPDLEQVRRARTAVEGHAYITMSGSEIDERHDGAFGLVLYGLDILRELTEVDNGTRIIGRMGLRSLVEARLTIAYLRAVDNLATWQQYRAYGADQAKLAFLKLLDTENLPGYVALDELDHLANEDMWQEMRDIQIGNWAGSDLRKMSDRAALKDTVYDAFYDWTSAFVHANWAAVRDAGFDLCTNPLHRLHRVPSAARTELPNVCADAADLVSGMLEDLRTLYPGLDAGLLNVAVPANDDDAMPNFKQTSGE